MLLDCARNDAYEGAKSDVTRGKAGRHTALATAKERPTRWAHRRHVLYGVTGSLVAVALVLALAAYAKFNSNITRIDVSRMLGVRPTTTAASAGADTAVNILVMGSDTRVGIGTDAYGKDTVEGGAHSDTNLLVHISADRDRVLVVSIPRDSMTKAPKTCSDPNSTVANGEVRQWNYNFNVGGPGCTIKTLEGLTGIFVDHYVVIDFRGFQQMVDALGGVPVCTTTDIADKDAQFTLAAGRHVLNGKQALGYVRVRKTVNDGSDLNRIKRQQAFLSSVAQEATSKGLLLRPDKLYGFLNAATKSMTTDPQMGFGTMTSLANSVRNLGVDKIEFVTVPTQVYPKDPNRVEWRDSAAKIWAAIRADQPLPGAGTKPTATSSSTPAPLTVSPEKIQVRISNDSGVEGLALQAGAALGVQGFQIAGYANGTPGDVSGAVIVYGQGQKEAARTVAAAFPGSTLKVDATVGQVIVVRLGPGAANPVAVPNRLGSDPLPAMTVSAGSSATDGLETRKADADICS